MLDKYKLLNMASSKNIDIIIIIIIIKNSNPIFSETAVPI